VSSPPAERFGWRLQGAVYASAFFTGNLFPMISVVMPLWALAMGASPLVIGLLVSSRQILTVTLSIHSGALMDRYGPRTVIMVLGAVGAAIMASFPLLPFIWAAILLQMASGFTETTNWIGTQAMVGKLLRGHAVYAGRMTAAARFGGFAGPWATGLCWQYGGPFAAFGFLAVWVFGGVIAAWFVPRHEDIPPPPAEPGAAPAPPPATRRGPDVMPKLSDYVTAFRLLALPAVALVILATFMRQAGSGMQSSFYGVWLNEAGFSAGTIGFLIGTSNMVSAFAALSIGPLTKRAADHWLLVAMITLSIVGVAITPLLPSFPLLVAAISLRGGAQGLNLPLMMSISSRAVGLDLQGRVAALRITFNRLGGALVPLAMGALAEVVGIERSFYIMGALGIVLIALLAVWVWRSPAFSGGSSTA
jgi:MFS family permease